MKNNAKEVNIYKNNHFLKKCESLKEAADFFSISYSHLSNVVRRGRFLKSGDDFYTFKKEIQNINQVGLNDDQIHRGHCFQREKDIGKAIELIRGKWFLSAVVKETGFREDDLLILAGQIGYKVSAKQFQPEDWQD